VGSAHAQEKKDSGYSRVYAFGVMGEYSDDLSHIFLGDTPGRRIGALGFQFQRRLIHSGAVDFSYAAEARPVMLVVNPTALMTYHYQYGSSYTEYTEVPWCLAGTYPLDLNNPANGTETLQCSHRTTYAEGLSPFGFRLNFFTRHRLQPVFANYEGYMFSTRPIPIATAGAFNFTFEFGAGFEWFLSHRRSVRVEYDLHHFSNKDSANANPGVDSGFFKVTWTFGR